MIREPYNITPYNSTIDTSRINEFGFTFSGDELGSWQAEVAKNNSSPEVLFTSKQYYPADAGYDRIFDSDRVEGTLVPGYIKATNKGINDGKLDRLYEIALTEGVTINSLITNFIIKKGEAVLATGKRINGNYMAVGKDTILSNGTFTDGVELIGLVDGGGASEEISGATGYNFAGYMLSVNNDENRVNFNSIDDAVQIGTHIFPPSIATNGATTGILELYLLNEEGIDDEPPTFFSIEGNVTYYIFTYNGQENDTYSGDEIIIDDIVSGAINSFVAEFEPYQEGEFWGPGMGVNKFNVESLGTQTSLSSNEMYSPGRGQPDAPKATANVSFSNNTFSFSVVLANFTGSSYTGTNLSFYFNDSISLAPIFKKGVSYYFEAFSKTFPTSSLVSLVSDFYFIVNYDTDISYYGPFPEKYKLYLSKSSGLNISETDCTIIGFGFKTTTKNTTIQIGLGDIVISEKALATGYSAYSNPYTFKSYNTFLLKNSNSNILEASIDTQIYNFYGGIFDKDGKLYEYNYIPSYNGENLENFRWWSSYEKFTPGTNPSFGAKVICKGVSRIIPITPTISPQNPLPSDLSTGSENIITIIGQGVKGSFSKKGTFQELNTTQSPDKSVVALRRAVGEDLIWRLKMWEPDKEYVIPHEEPEEDETIVNPNTTNFIKRGRFLQDASDRIGNNTYEGEVSLLITENIKPEQSGFNYVQIGNDLFIEKNIGEITATIMPSIIYTDLAKDMATFAQALTPNNCLLEIDNYQFEISSAKLSDDQSYITLTLTSIDGLTNDLISKSYYDYTIEFLSDPGDALPLINGYVEKYKYTIIPDDSSELESPYPEFMVRVGNAMPNEITTMYYWLYSDGTPRAFYTLENEVKGEIRGREYRFYNNFYNSNWYFFQSRSTPQLNITYKDGSSVGSFPAIDYNHRMITLYGDYSQADDTPVKYHTWQIDKIDGDNVETVFQTKEIYNKNFVCTFDSLEKTGTYIVTFTVVNQDGVETTITGDLTTNFEIQEIKEGTCKAIVNNNSHVAEVTWMNGLISEPDEGETPSGDFGNHIGVGPTEGDITINDHLTYSTIAGTPYKLDKNNFAFQAGFVINDDAKVGGKNEEFYDSIFLKFDGDNATNFNKNGLNVNINERSTLWTLLEDTDGQVQEDEAAYANFFLGKNYIWDENDGNTWKETYGTEPAKKYLWTETQSDTNCYYYQMLIDKNQNLSVWKTPFKRVSGTALSGITITIPYNPLLAAASSVSARLYNGVKDSESIVYACTRTNSTSTQTLSYTLGGYTSSSFEVTQIVVYATNPTQVIDPISITDYLPSKINSIVIGPKTWFFYFTLYDVSQNPGADIVAPPFGDKPSWKVGEDEDSRILLNPKFNGSNVSSKYSEISSGVDTYKVYRLKYRPISNNSTEDEIIYRRLVGEFDLTDEDLATALKFRFIDWTIENKGIFDYEIVPSSSATGITEATIKSGNKIITDWYGWSFTEIAKFRDTWHYEPVERWLFKLNVETNGYSHQTNKVFHQGFNRYPKASIGMTNYITTNVSCLIGDIRKELQRITYYAKQQGYTRDTIESIQAWEDFSNTSNMILVKDYKGRAFIGVIDGNAMSFQDVVVDILTTLSFNITQIDDAANYQIFSVEEG